MSKMWLYTIYCMIIRPCKLYKLLYICFGYIENVNFRGTKTNKSNFQFTKNKSNRGDCSAQNGEHS